LLIPILTQLDIYEVFDSIYRDSLLKILRHYGIPSKLVNVIKMLYNDFESQVICNTALTDVFSVTTWVRNKGVFPSSHFSVYLGDQLAFETSDWWWKKRD